LHQQGAQRPAARRKEKRGKREGKVTGDLARTPLLSGVEKGEILARFWQRRAELGTQRGGGKEEKRHGESI